MAHLTIFRSFGFDAAHRVLHHESKCRHLHGHRYTAEVGFTADRLDALGRVVDFSVCRDLVGGWIESNLDHNTILNPADPLALHPQRDEIVGRVPFIMPNHFTNPTVENLLAVLWMNCKSLLVDRGVRIHKIRLYETPNCFAEQSFPQYGNEVDR